MKTKTTTAKPKNTFRKLPGGGPSVFKCNVCGRRTRHTGEQSLGCDSCPQCFELAGIENEISDGHTTQKERQPMIDGLLAEIKAKGGDLKEWASFVVAPKPADTIPDAAFNKIFPNCPSCKKNDRVFASHMFGKKDLTCARCKKTFIAISSRVAKKNATAVKTKKETKQQLRDKQLRRSYEVVAGKSVAKKARQQKKFDRQIARLTKIVARLGTMGVNTKSLAAEVKNLKLGK